MERNTKKQERENTWQDNLNFELYKYAEVSFQERRLFF
jgi:hypothetical protein